MYLCPKIIHHAPPSMTFLQDLNDFRKGIFIDYTFQRCLGYNLMYITNAYIRLRIYYKLVSTVEIRYLHARINVNKTFFLIFPMKIS